MMQIIFNKIFTHLGLFTSSQPGFIEITGNTNLAPRDFILINLIGVGIVSILFFIRDRSVRDQLFSTGFLMIKAKIKQARQIIGLTSITLNKYYYNLKYININTAKPLLFATTTIFSVGGAGIIGVAVGLTDGLPSSYYELIRDLVNIMDSLEKHGTCTGGFMEEQRRLWWLERGERMTFFEFRDEEFPLYPDGASTTREVFETNCRARAVQFMLQE